jgi:hypothetical protein
VKRALPSQLRVWRLADTGVQSLLSRIGNLATDEKAHDGAKDSGQMASEAATNTAQAEGSVKPVDPGAPGPGKPSMGPSLST